MMVANPRIFACGLAVLVCAAASHHASAQSQRVATQTAVAENKSRVQRWIDEGFNRRNLDVVDEVFAESFAINGREVRRDGLKESMRRRLTAFPDLHVTIDDVVAEGNQVVIWYTAHGTQRAEYEGIAPTGKEVTWIGSDLLRFRQGRITHARFVDDALGLMRQLGMTVEPPRAPK